MSLCNGYAYSKLTQEEVNHENIPIRQRNSKKLKDKQIGEEVDLEDPVKFNPLEVFKEKSFPYLTDSLTTTPWIETTYKTKQFPSFVSWLQTISQKMFEY